MDQVKEVYCDECNKHQDFIFKKVDRTYRVKDKMVNVNILISICPECKEEIWGEDLIARNQKIIFEKYKS